MLFKNEICHLFLTKIIISELSRQSVDKFLMSYKSWNTLFGYDWGTEWKAKLNWLFTDKKLHYRISKANSVTIYLAYLDLHLIAIVHKLQTRCGKAKRTNISESLFFLETFGPIEWENHVESRIFYTLGKGCHPTVGIFFKKQHFLAGL